MKPKPTDAKKVLEMLYGAPKPAVSRLDMNFKDVTKRMPELQQAARLYEQGKITREQYYAIVDQLKPVTPYEFIPKPATAEEALAALTSDKVKDFGRTDVLTPGETILSRLDIPAYSKKGTWVTSQHRLKPPADEPKTIYTPTMMLEGETKMMPGTGAARRVAKGEKQKSSFATIRGAYKPGSDEEAVERAIEALRSKDYAQIGYDPERRGFFYDRRTMEPIIGTEEGIIQIGPLVLGKKPVRGNPEDFEYAGGGAISALSKIGQPAKAAKSAPKQVPSTASLSAQERAANLAKFLEGSAIQERVYHGTGEDISKFRKSNQGNFGSGIYTITDPKSADLFTKERVGGEGGQNIMPLYVSLKKPFYTKADYSQGDAFDLDSPSVPLIKEIYGKSAPSVIANLRRGSGYLGENVRKRLMDMGHDGIIAEYPDGLKEYIAFRPDQLKSAIGNRGTFDPSDPDITKAKGGAVHMQDGGTPLDQVKDDLTILPEEDAWNLLKGLDRIYTPKIGEYIADVQSPAELLGRIKDLDPEYVDALTSGLSELVSQTQPVGPNSFDSVPKYQGSDPLDKLNRQEIDEAAWQVYENPALASTFVNVLQNPLAYTMTESAVDQPRDIKAEIWNEAFPKWKEDLLGAPADIQPLTKQPEDEELGSSYQGLMPLLQARLGDKGQQQYRNGGAVHMQDGGRLPPGIKRATERAKESKSVLPVAGARQARQAIQGYLGMDPSFSVMDPEAQALESAYRGGETASVLGDLFASLTPFATASALSKANQVPGLAELIAYHGSPHKFKKFDASKIGTGEGAQVFGHGLYFAENPNVARSYQTNLSFKDLVKDFRRQLPDDASAEEVIEMADQLNPKLRNVVNELANNDWLGFDYPAQALTAAMKDIKNFDVTPALAKAVKDAQGSFYTVDIPDEKIAQMLDWDKPLSQQPKAVQDAFQNSDVAFRDMAYEIYKRKDPLGSDLARSGLDAEDFADHMRSLGVPGISYLDRGSRGTGIGTRNFVLFPGEEQNIKMLDINGEPQMAAGGAVNMQDGGSPLDQFYQPANPMARRAAQQELMRQEIARRRAEELARQQTPLDTSLPGPSPTRPGLPSMADLKGAFERRVMPVISEAKQTAMTGGILGDLVRAYGEASVPVNQAMATALGRPFEQERPPAAPPEMTVPTAFERRGDIFQQLAGQAIGDPANLLDPGILRGLEAGARAVKPSVMRGLEAGTQAVKPFAKTAAEMVEEMAMKGVPGTDAMQLRMGILPETPKLPSLTDEALPAPKIEGEAPTGGMSIRPEQLELPVSQVVKRGEEVPPMTTPPTPEQVAAARADTRMGADIVADRLNVIVPEAERVLGGIYKPGRPDGGKWSDLTPEELSKNLPGFPGTDADLNRMWDETLSEVSQAARDAVARTGATWQGFPAADFDVAMRLPLRNQLWYELSGEAFVDRVPDASLRESLILLDLVGATSARARPEENLERALAILSQRLRGVPVDVDITIPSTVTQALNRSGTNISSDLANKTGMFSDTIALTGGIPVRYPISVNDVWEGRTYGITDEALSKNQPLHEVFAKYQNKVRDFVNENGDFPYPVQSWNVQALKWVKKRFDDLGIDPLGPASLQGSDYAAEFDKIVNKLERAGIKVPNGQITRDVLLNPKTADALRPTTPGFRKAPKATVEFGTLLTPAGQRAAQIYEAAKNTGDELTQQEYRNILLSAMRDSSRGKPTPWESLARVASDEALSVTRIAAPTQDDPFSISGTFMGAAGPNIRIPLKELTPDQIAYFNSVAGLGLKQKAMAAAEILRLDPDMSLPQGFVPTHSIRFDFSGRVPETMLTDFAKALGEGFEISAMRYPDGMVFDINPRFGDAGPEAATHEAINAATSMLQSTYNAKNLEVFPSAYRSEYGKNYVEDPGNGSEYNRIIKDTLKGWNNEAAEKIAQLAGRSVNAKNINAFLAGKLENLPIDRSKVASASELSSIQGKAKTIRKGLRQRLSDHDAALKAFNDIGLAVDSKMAAAIPKWDKRAAAMARREQTKQGPEPEMAKGGRVHISNNLDTMLLELMRNKRYG